MRALERSFCTAHGARLGGIGVARAPVVALSTTASVCAHCASPIALGRAGPFCCDGCAAVNSLLSNEGLLGYYDRAPGRRAPAGSPSAASATRPWLDDLAAQVSRGECSRARLDVQGLQCTGCVWLLQELFTREPGALRIEVNPALGSAELLVDRSFPLEHYAQSVEAFGYRFGPAPKGEDARERDLLLRLGVCAAIAMNAMIFSLPLYLGLREGSVYHGFRALSFVLGLTAVLVGGSVFVRSAWAGLRRGVLHLDLPIALGVLLAFAGSVANFALGNDRGAYFDTLSLFVALMLGGRWLQERLLASNRRRLLADESAENLRTRRIEGGSARVVRCGDLREGDELLLARHDLVPVDCELLDDGTTCSLEWIRGESAPVEFARGATVPAGSFHLGAQSVRVRARTDFAGSPLPALLRTTSSDRGDASAKRTAWWASLSRWYALGVLAVASSGFLGWYLATGSFSRAVEITTAVLVVTCPCAFGLATPLAYELAHAGLRRVGLFVRSAALLDRALSVRVLCFDKTGTLTTGSLRLADAGPLLSLSERDRDALYQLVARSSHPKSSALRDAMPARPLDLAAPVVEHAGRGVELASTAGTYRLGSRAFAAPNATSTRAGDLFFSLDGAVLAALRTEEEPREDAREELSRLARDGYVLEVLSGDEPRRVHALCAQLGAPFARTEGALSPYDKADRVRSAEALYGPALMLGDGVNDGPAFDAATCAGTPAVDRPFVPSRADFYVTAPGLAPLRTLLRVARALQGVHRRNLALALAYNVLTVGLALSGRMSPLLCAALMPLSSLLTIVVTAVSLSPRRSLWK